MWKELDQIMLPTNGNKFSKLKISDDNGKLEYSNLGCQLYKYQNFYVTSEEKIKEGNWVLIRNFDIKNQSKIVRVKEFVKIAEINYIIYEEDCKRFKVVTSYCKKIIASTDESLEFIRHELYPNGNTTGVRSLIEIPKLPLSWINLTIEQYNSGNPINKVLVEHNDEGICRFHQRDGGYDDRLIGGDLRLNSDNTINIKLEKKSWNKEELIDLCQDAWNSSTTGDDESCYCFADWLRENNLF